MQMDNLILVSKDFRPRIDRAAATGAITNDVDQLVAFHSAEVREVLVGVIERPQPRA